jgi:hypothetical protein
MQTVSLVRTPGQTLYAFPDRSFGFSLADWTTHRELISEGTGANTGVYTASLDETKATLWRVFVGASQPSNWNQSVAYFSIPGSAGDHVLTVTVTDSTTDLPIQNATVTLTRTGQRAVETTNATGVATVGADAATWTYVIRAAGYESRTGTVVISADQSLAVELDAIILPTPSNPDMSVLTILCLDANGDPEQGVSIDIRIVTVPSGDLNIAYKGAKQTALSDANGYATLQAIKGAVYEYKRGKAEVWAKVTIGAGVSTNVQSVIGSP